MPFTFLRNDITKKHVNVIVNAANTDLARGGRVCGANFKAAGVAKLQAACDALAPIRTEEAVITPGFASPPSISSIRLDLYVKTASRRSQVASFLLSSMPCARFRTRIHKRLSKV